MDRIFLRLPRTRNSYPVRFTYSGVRWKQTGHGPQAWPWWRLFSWLWCSLDFRSESTGNRLWIYTRWGCFHFDFIVDRRSRA